jgi:hypothetical protein
MGRPPSPLDDYREWQQRLERFAGSDLSLEVFCLQEGVSRSTFYRWKDRLKDGIPKSTAADEASPGKPASTESMFLPISLQGSLVEIELPNGGVVRLPVSIDQRILVSIVRVVGSLRPWRSPDS